MGNKILKGAFEDHEGNVLYPRTSIDQVDKLDDIIDDIQADIESVEYEVSAGVKIYTQQEEPKDMKVGDQWHRVVSM